MNITLSEDIKELLEELNKIGEAIVFGGYLRDRFFKNTPNDVDIATNISIEKIEEKYKHMEKAKRRKTTSGHDVFSFKMHKREKIFVEIVSIQTNLLDKSHHADYTINSLLHDGEKLIDLQNAQNDINKKIVREVDAKIIENDLKSRPFLWLKTLRLLSMTGFSLSEKTFRVLNENKKCIENISAEILQTEGHKTLNGKNPFKSMEILSKMGFLKDFSVKENFKEGEMALQPQQKLCLLAILSSKETIDDYVKFYHFQQDLIDKYEKLYKMYYSEERPPSRFRNQIITMKKIIGE